MKAIIILTCVVLLGLMVGRAPAATEGVSTVFAAAELTPTPSQTPTPKADNEFRQALADIWIEDDHTKIGNVSIVRKCSAASENDYFDECELSIYRGKKVVRTFSVEYARKIWLRYGFTDLLGKGSKQLIIHTYSGGAHCCYDYVIYDLFPTVRVIYDSTATSSANAIGDELIPVNIEGDGILEFYRHVMAFDYLGPNGHASASFPPAIFAYDQVAKRYLLATKRFPDFVMKLLEPLIDPTGEENDVERFNEYVVRTRFLFMVYAGKRDDAWKYFDANYRSPTAGDDQDEFKEQLRAEFKQRFATDPTYLSIYGK
ncbi:MAG TPA: hypothetical protein PKC65_14435 [Pyrinomonadaceae bacterium]|nr:hypothetical protein [Pyrinomonadaceae bacterium]